MIDLTEIAYQKEVRTLLRQTTTLPNKHIMKITKHLKNGEDYTPQFVAAYEELVKLVKEKKI